MGEFLYEALGDPNFYVGALAVIVPVFVALVSRRRNKLFFDVVCEAMLIELKDGDGKEKQAAKKTERSRNGIGRVLFIIDLRNPSWGVLG